MSEEVKLGGAEEAIAVARRHGLDWTRTRLYQLASSGVLPVGPVVLREGRRLHWRLDGLEEWIRGGGSGFAGGWRRKPKPGS